jgi:hypothetical protein
MNNSNYLNLNWKDFGKGLVVAVITAFFTAVSLSVNSGHLPSVSDFKTAGLTAAVAGFSYLIKNFVSNSNGEPLKSEQTKVL